MNARRQLLRLLLTAPCLAMPSLDAVARRLAPPPEKGSLLKLPDMPLLEGGTFKAAEADGRVLVVYWWASWCPFCAEMSPHVEKLWREQRERGLLVLGISTDRTAEAAIAYRRRRNLTFPSVLYDAKVEPMLPKPKAVPTTWVRLRDGRVREVIPGQMFPEDVAGLAKYLRS